MMLIKFEDAIINMQNIQGIILSGTKIKFDTGNDGYYYVKKYSTKQDAKDVYERLVAELMIKVDTIIIS